MKIMLVTVFLIGLSACTTMSRSTSSGYYTSDFGYDSPKLYAAKSTEELDDQSKTELGLDSSRELTERERIALEERTELKRLEGTIASQKERQQYYKYKTLLRTDREKIEFLKLGDFFTKERWISTQGITTSPNRYDRNIASLIQEQDIAIGMSKQAVEESWGDPKLVEVSGDPMYGNERWTYSFYNASPEGYQEEKRVVYFEGGRVIGWERQ